MDGLQTSRHIKSDETLSHQPAIVLVTAFGREEVREEAERLQLDGFLVKPVTKSMIVDTLVNVFSETEGQIASATEGRQSVRLNGARILLAEDNEINQQIAVELLEGSGATVRVAGNGREAVDLLTSGPQPPPFDVVLMDLQMPVMDGYKATAMLRADARFAALPIIAMTAHATFEERQRCLDAGMNDHVSKPIDPENLFETVEKHCLHRALPAAPEPNVSAEAMPRPAEFPAIPGLDHADGLSRVGGNQMLYQKLLRQFAAQQASAVHEISAALAQRDTTLAERLAHTLKGVAGNIGAKPVHAAAGALEKLIRGGADSAEADPALQQLGAALDPLLQQLKASDLPAPDIPPPACAPAAFDPALIRGNAAELIKLLSEFDPGAADFIGAKGVALRPLFPDNEWTEFEMLVQNYSFAEALAQLDQAVRGLPAP
jgi:CheY-like chemotaxis protein